MKPEAHATRARLTENHEKVPPFYYSSFGELYTQTDHYHHVTVVYFIWSATASVGQNVSWLREKYSKHLGENAAFILLYKQECGSPNTFASFQVSVSRNSTLHRPGGHNDQPRDKFESVSNKNAALLEVV